MVQNLNTKIAMILVALILAIYVLVTKDITLGLDLSGGSSLRYKLPIPEETADKDRVIEDTIEVFRKRIDSIGLKEIPIRSQGTDEILIDLPGMSKNEVETIIQIIQSQGNLNWLMVAETEKDSTNPNEISIDIDSELGRLVELLKQKEADGTGWDLETDLTSLDVNLTINGRDVRYRWFPMDPKTLERFGNAVPAEGSTFEALRPAETATDEQIARIYFKLLKIFKDPKWRFGGQDLISVQPSYDDMRMPAVGFEFKPERAGDFGAFTKAHIKKNMAIVLDGKVSTDPVIQSELPGSGIISGPKPKGFLPDEQKQLLTVLRSGSILVKPILLSRHDIGPTLGENSIKRGELAALIGFGTVFAFIIAYYLLSGIVASISLAINLTLLMGVLVFLEATLTLPGIAGIVLTVGMAVDANILIFERIREEKIKGKTIAQSVKNGFERAFLTIVDANATTFITGFILFQFGSGPIKGFAVTLMIGIATSLFSALIISKVIFAIMLERGLEKLNMMRFLKEVAVDFLAMRKKAAFLSVIVIITGLAVFLSEDDSKYGLDFTGGYSLHLTCWEGTTQADVQTRLGAEFPNVQVISVKADQAGSADSTVVYNVKIKSTVLEELDMAAVTGEEGDSSGPQELVSDVYLEKIRSIMGDRILQDPISGLELTPQEATESTAVKATLHFVGPPITDEQLATLAGGDPAQVYQENIQGALEDFIEGTAFIFSKEGRQLDLVGVYKRSSTVTTQRVKAGFLRQFKDAQEKGIPVYLSDPFPMTDYIGPTVGVELRDKTIIAIFFSLLAIIIYVRLRFKEYKYGFAASIALVHDVLITLGAVAFIRLTGLVDIEIDLPIIAAFLTIIGYSLNDTIVVFDRIRENIPRMNRPIGEMINTSINQTLARTLLTSLTTLIVLVTLFSINYGQRNVLEGFSFAMIVGVVVGTYSSIFVASPVLYMLYSREAAAGPSTVSKSKAK